MRALLCTSLALIALALSGAPAAASRTDVSPRTDVSFELFRWSLAPYGSWHTSTSFGRVWIPRVHVIGWHPYAYGHWEYTDLGWAWSSDEEWGAIPYHYGTWALDPEFGWVWVPGYEWAPAWVVFRSGPSYVGWAPVPPSFSIRSSGSSSSLADYGADHFVFVRQGDFLAARIHELAIPSARTRAVFGETEIVPDNLRIENDVVVNRGLDPENVERAAQLRTRGTRRPRPEPAGGRRAPRRRGSSR
jgi:hypothetical protein